MDLKWIKGEPPKDGREYLVYLKGDVPGMGGCRALVQWYRDEDDELVEWCESWTGWMLFDREILYWMDVPKPEEE